MNEIFKDIPDYEGLYQVSNLGRVKSLERYVNCKSGCKALKKGKILKIQKNNNGYSIVGLHKNGKRKLYLIHRLVYESFNGPIPDGMQVNHINEDKTDNHLENLNLMDCKTNINWGTHNKRVSEKMTNGKRSITVLQYDLDNNFIKEWVSVNEVHRQLGFSCGNISLSCRGFYKSYKGYVWKYK